jgi:small nuclear ribonucleoprotein F
VLSTDYGSHDYSINEDVLVRLKWGQTEYKGRLISVDSYMNIQLSGTEEFIDGKSTGSLGQVLIRYDTSQIVPSSRLSVGASRFYGLLTHGPHGRCNNVLWISAAKGVEMNGAADTKMES